MLKSGLTVVATRRRQRVKKTLNIAVGTTNATSAHTLVARRLDPKSRHRDGDEISATPLLPIGRRNLSLHWGTTWQRSGKDRDAGDSADWKIANVATTFSTK